MTYKEGGRLVQPPGLSLNHDAARLLAVKLILDRFLPSFLHKAEKKKEQMNALHPGPTGNVCRDRLNWSERGD